MTEHESKLSSASSCCDLAALGLDEYVPSITYTSWGLLKSDGYDTRTNWKYDHRMVVEKGQKASAAYVEQKVYTSEQWYAAKRDLEDRRNSLEGHADHLERLNDFTARLKVTSLGAGRIAVTKKWIPLFHHSQMRPGKFRERTDAIIKYAKVFWRSSNRTNFIKKNFDPAYNARWFTKGSENQECELEPAQYFGEWMLLDHLRQRHVYGLKADPDKPQWWGAIDLDLHIEKGGTPDIFMRQAEAVLRRLQGEQWRVCLGKERVNGLHAMKFFDQPVMLAKVHECLHAVLDQLSAENPELEREAIAAGMTPIKQVEIYPSATRGFRLPLGIGYTALLDKPLSLVKYCRHHGVDLMGADVVGFMNWDGSEMSLEEKLAHIRDRLPQEVAGNRTMELRTSRLQSCQKAASISTDIERPKTKVLGHMKGRFKDVLVDFYSGRMQNSKSLQAGILLGVDALWTVNYPLEDRADYLLGLLQDIEITNPDFSSRINNGAWEEIHAEIERVIETREKLRAEPDASEEVQRSNDILKNWAKAMEKAGFSFADRSTWEKSWESAGDNRKYLFTPTEDEIELIAQRIAPVFVCSPNVAVQAVIKMVELAAIKVRTGQGMNREYRRELLSRFGISCQKNSKLARCGEIVEACGFISRKAKAVFKPGCPGAGRATVYGVGERVEDRIYGIADNHLEIPDWMAEMLAEMGAPMPWPGRKMVA